MGAKSRGNFGFNPNPEMCCPACIFGERPGTEHSGCCKKRSLTVKTVDAALKDFEAQRADFTWEPAANYGMSVKVSHPDAQHERVERICRERGAALRKEQEETVSRILNEASRCSCPTHTSIIRRGGTVVCEACGGLIYEERVRS